jgi:F-type H+-transporting ATPase subunit O
MKRFASTLEGIHGRYANALFSAAKKQGKIDQIALDLSSLKPSFQNPKIASFLSTPILDKQAKVTGVNALLARTNVDQLTKNFFVLLAENGRLDQSPKILESFSHLVDSMRGHVTVTVTSAKVSPLKLTQFITMHVVRNSMRKQ